MAMQIYFYSKFVSLISVFLLKKLTSNFVGLMLIYKVFCILKIRK